MTSENLITGDWIPLNSFMSWVGGKKALREEVVKRFPVDYDRYIEVFGGGGWVLFYRNPRNDFEVYNDYNSLLTNLYRCVREQPHDMWSNFPLIEQAHRRLAKVVIENVDFERLIRHYDRPDSLFYCDPPYHSTEGYYQ